MPTEITFETKLSGFEELTACLKALGPEVGGRALKQAMMKASKPFKDEITARAPYLQTRYQRPSDPSKDPGALKRSVRSIFIKKGHSTESPCLRTGCALWYGLYLEFGDERMPARPFVGPAVDAVIDRVFEDFKQQLGPAIDKAWEKYGFVK